MAEFFIIFALLTVPAYSRPQPFWFETDFFTPSTKFYDDIEAYQANIFQSMVNSFRNEVWRISQYQVERQLSSPIFSGTVVFGPTANTGATVFVYTTRGGIDDSESVESVTSNGATTFNSVVDDARGTVVSRSGNFIQSGITIAQSGFQAGHNSIQNGFQTRGDIRQSGLRSGNVVIATDIQTFVPTTGDNNEAA